MPTIHLRPKDAIDLQIHTIYSDGHWQAEALFAYLAGADFRAVSITDHDRVDVRGELQALGAAHGVHVVPGVELTTSWRGRSAHLLCYALRLADGAVARLAQATTRAQEENTHQVYEALLRRGFRFPRQRDVLAENGGQLKRPVDNARLLEAHGYADDEVAALALIAEAGYRSIAAPLAEAVAAAHRDDALAILAHPGRGGGEIQRYDPPLLDQILAEVPVDGIEAWYPTHTAAQTATYNALAAARGLLVSAGSDSHGPHQRLPVAYPADACGVLLARCGVEVSL